MKLEQLARRLLVTQAILIAILASAWGVYSGYLDAVSVVYGGLVSIVLAWLHKLGVGKAEEVTFRDVRAGMQVLMVSAVVRFILLIVLLAVGFGLLKFSPLPMLVGFVAAQLGFLIFVRR